MQRSDVEDRVAGVWAQKFRAEWSRRIIVSEVVDDGSKEVLLSYSYARA